MVLLFVLGVVKDSFYKKVSFYFMVCSAKDYDYIKISVLSGIKIKLN